MGLFDSIGKVFTNPATLMAIATMNPAIIAATVGRQLVSAVGQEVIQQLGQELGLPQSAIDMAQGAFAASMGDAQGAQQNYREAASGIVNDFFEQFNVSPVDRGNVERSVNDLRTSMSDELNDFMEASLEGRDTRELAVKAMMSTRPRAKASS